MTVTTATFGEMHTHFLNLECLFMKVGNDEVSYSEGGREGVGGFLIRLNTFYQ